MTQKYELKNLTLFEESNMEPSLFHIFSPSQEKILVAPPTPGNIINRFESSKLG